MKWIKCSDEMPAIGQKVIFFVRDRSLSFCGWVDKEKGALIFRENLDDWWFRDEHITHWMPIPKQPEE
jgi:hypothetical protein